MGKVELTAYSNLDRLRELASYYAGSRGVEVSIGVADSDRLSVSLNGNTRAFDAESDSGTILDFMDDLAARPPFSVYG